ncbi:dipeptidase [Roseomonas sp. BN140053]|uniref:dipeptidase n=1 Tax=Roseomonas sp. BN140053 TaxID=3391898 RepID=UPI0039ED46EA
MTLDLAAVEARLLRRLDGLLRIPSVSTDPAYAGAMRDAQRYLLAWLGDLGFADMQVLEGGGHAAVFAQRLEAPGLPTLLVYGHYDVQPPDPLDLWKSPPFEPTLRNGRLYARGAADDKGPVAIALEAIGALLERDGKLPVNLKVLLEGEEEVGSRTLPVIVQQNATLLAADVVLSADGARWRADLPTVTVATRGNTGFGFTVRTAAKDLHSGRYGGTVRNALHVVAELVAALHDAEGRIAVPGFYDGIVDPDPTERAAATGAIPFDEAALFESIGAAPYGEAGHGTLERLWFRPTLDANGLWGGYQGPGSKTVIPCEAHAKLTMRLVPGQEPEAVKAKVMAHLRSLCPAGVSLEIGETRAGAPAYQVPGDHPVLLAIEETLAEVHGVRPLRVRMGATLPVNALFRDALGAETLMLSYATADEDFHAPNEFIRLSAIGEGLRAWTLLLQRLGTAGRLRSQP